jgi:membrane dipeptidase
MNHTLQKPPYSASAAAVKLHRSLFIADLHADSLLWGRNLLKKSEDGHVDIPRLIEANVGLQAFTVVTKSPRGLNVESNSDQTDNITLEAIVGLWPIRTWSSLKERALYQAERLHRFADHSNGEFVLIQNQRTLQQYLEFRKSNAHITAGFLGLEGSQAIEGNLANVDVLYDAGFRMMAPTHFFDTEIGGSAHGIHKGGLTPLGKEWVRKLESKKIFIDIAHASPATIGDILKLASRPIIDSHTGVKGTCNNIRNLSDAQLRGVAQTGGVIGIGYWDTATCGNDVDAIVRAIQYAVRVVGSDHVALGSDFDGAITAPFDTTGIVEITDKLLAAGFSERDIRNIMGGNVLRLMEKNL